MTRPAPEDAFDEWPPAGFPDCAPRRKSPAAPGNWEQRATAGAGLLARCRSSLPEPRKIAGTVLPAAGQTPGGGRR